MTKYCEKRWKLTFFGLMSVRLYEFFKQSYTKKNKMPDSFQETEKPKFKHIERLFIKFIKNSVFVRISSYKMTSFGLRKLFLFPEKNRSFYFLVV